MLAGPKCEPMLQLVFGKYAAGTPLRIALVNQFPVKRNGRTDPTIRVDSGKPIRHLFQNARTISFPEPHCDKVGRAFYCVPTRRPWLFLVAPSTEFEGVPHHPPPFALNAGP